MVIKKKTIKTPTLKRKAKLSKNKRKGQTKGKGYPKNLYVKAGKLHKKSLKRDRAVKAKKVRKRGEPAWRGDLKGKRV